jgi:ectoine hydroxylase-related dioxygenase (phytanoyl-CoA dioxygenase family)
MDSSFAQQGFATFPAVLTATEITELIEDLLSLSGSGKAGIRHALSLPKVTALAHDPRLITLSEEFIGPGALPFRATLFNKSPDTNWLITWHQDTALPLRQKRELSGWGPWSVKQDVVYAHAPASALSQILALRVHLDDSTTRNGPLRVLPGTHRLGVLDDDQIHELSTQTASVTCTVPRGGILAMRPLLIHASSKSDSQLPRRVLHIEYSAVRVFTDGMELAIA